MIDIEITEEMLSDIASRISHDEDRCMFEDVAKTIRAKANRSAYIMIWITCAESLKRRLLWSSEKDSQAGKLWGEIEEAEGKHHAVDAKLVDACKKIGIISDVESTRLSQIYENRNIYGHPYNVAPDQASILAAVNTVVDAVLSKENKLRHAYAEERLKFLTQDATYLEDDVKKVEDYAVLVADRMDRNVHKYFLMRYIEAIETIWSDPEQKTFKRRGQWFCRRFLEYVRADTIILADEWHDLMAKMPNFISWLAGWRFVFPSLSEAAKDEAVLKNIEMSGGNPQRLNMLYTLSSEGYLSESQRARFDEKCKSLTPYELGETEIPLAYVIEEVLKRLSSPWYGTANSGATILFWTKVRELSVISTECQHKVGARLADAALSNAFDAMHAVKRIADSEIDVPYPVKYEYCLHFFSKRVEYAITREPLCDNSLKVLCMLKEEDAKKIDDQLRETANVDADFAAAMQSEVGKKFVQKYKDIKTPPF